MELGVVFDALRDVVIACDRGAERISAAAAAAAQARRLASRHTTAGFDDIPQRSSNGTWCDYRSLSNMSASTLLLVVIAVFAIGGLCGFLLAALLQMARDGDGRRPTLDARGLHPLDLPTQ